jgi:hypothetical protein
MQEQHGYAPAPTGADGGFFAPPRPAEPAWGQGGIGYGPTPPGSFGGPSSGGPVGGRAVTGGVPAFVAAAAAFFVLAGVAALWLGLAGMVVVNAAHVPVGAGTEVDSFVLRGLFLLGNGAVDFYLAYQLVRGQQLAKILASVVCGWWVLYWIYQASQASSAFGKASSAAREWGLHGLGQVGTVATLGLLLLAAWAGATAWLVWSPSASKHFS